MDERSSVVLARSWPLLVSIALLMVGAGLQGSLVGLRAPAEGFAPAVVGVVLASYYAGYVLGSAWVPTLIRAVGHIRTFTGLASLASVAMLLHGFALSAAPWVAFRLLTGLCLAGLFVVAESWLGASGGAGTRGTLLAVYMLVVTASLAGGQFLLQSADVSGPILFVVTSVLVSMAVVPMSLAPQPTPHEVVVTAVGLRRVITEVPVSVAGSMAAGAGVGALLGFGALEAQALGFDLGGIALFMAAVPAGSAVFQLPLGRWSDRTDRRRVMAVVTGVGAVVAVIGALLADDASLRPFLLVAFALGGTFFPLYSLAVAHLSDLVDAEHIVGSGARMIMVNGVGAAISPVVLAPLVDRFGPGSFFTALAVLLVFTSSYIVYRLTRRETIRVDEQGTFSPVPHTATIGAVELEARSGHPAGRTRPR